VNFTTFTKSKKKADSEDSRTERFDNMDFTSICYLHTLLV